MQDMVTFLDALVAALQQASAYDKNVQVPPEAVLWTDKERQWKSLLPVLCTRLPILTLGDYAPKQRTGLYWLRCMLAHSLPDDILPVDVVPVIYLPGISRSDLRAIEDCPRALQPIAELQYRGVLWTQKNGNDWTVQAFLVSNNGGLGIEVAGDQATREAMKRALLKLADEPLERLRREAPLKASFFDALLNPDEVRSLLLWMNDLDSYRLKVSDQEWQAFCNVCKSKFGLYPEEDGPISAAQLLGFQNGNWSLVWTRFHESPRAYPNLPALLRQARPPQGDLFDYCESWPQDNETAEEQLQQQLQSLPSLTAQDARAFIGSLEEQHGERRTWVWAGLGKSPLVISLEHLANLSKLSQKPLVGSTVSEIAQAYLEWGWKVDQAALKALTSILSSSSKAEDAQAVKTAVQAVYRPWLEDAASTMQKAVGAGDKQSYPYQHLDKPEPGTCILFSDALRMDAGRCLAMILEQDGYQAPVTPQLAALPSVTPTSKPALLLDHASLTGSDTKGLTLVLSKTRSISASICSVTCWEGRDTKSCSGKN